MSKDYLALTKVLKAVSEPNRLQILEMLSCGELCACDILAKFGFTQPTLSHHMKVLVQAGLVRARVEGKWHFYSLEEETVTHFLREVTGILTLTEECPCNQESHC